ncbi:MAG TPA: hypothetical protein VMH22_08585 [bacterium]|nr:hypothetical protein [bacterium]
MSLLLALTILGQAPPLNPPDSLQKRAVPINIERTSVHEESDQWFAIDKFWHFSASFATVGAAYDLSNYRLNMKSPWPTTLSLGGTAVLGVSKEFYDLAGPTKHFSWKDLAADAAGIVVGYFAFIHHF